MAKAQSTNGHWGSWIRTAGWGFAAALMLVPVIGMQVSEEWQWTGSDFVFAGVMIGGTGLLLELTARASASWAYRGGMLFALAANFLLIWINGAVGIIGDENNPANLMYLGVIGIALIGALVARFRPQGMALAMGAAALAQMGVALIALVAGLGADEPPGPLGFLILNGLFAGLWLLSAWLFGRAARG